MKLEVGKTYKLNNGEIHTCTEMNGDDPLAVDSIGYGPFVIDWVLYHQDGTFGRGDLHNLNVASCVDDTPTTWRDMTDAEKGALLLAHHEGKVVENSFDGSHWVASEPIWAGRYTYRIKPEPKVGLTEGTCWAYHCDGAAPYLATLKIWDICTEGKWTATRVDGNLTKITWDAI